MSKVLEALEARFTGNRKALNSTPLVTVSENISEVTPLSYTDMTYEYTIQATFGAYGFCQKKDLGAMHENVYKELKVELYGSLQTRILRLERQLYEEYYMSETVRSMLRDIKTEIF